MTPVSRLCFIDLDPAVVLVPVAFFFYILIVLYCIAVTARVVEKREINDWTSVDAVAFSEEEDNNDANRYPVKTKKPKVVKF